MSRIKAEIQKKTLNLRSGDWDYIESIAKPEGLPTSEVIRMLVSNFVDMKRRSENPPDFSDIELDL